MRAEEIRALARQAGIAPGVSVLNLCCGIAGPGRFTTQGLGCTYLGVDLDAPRATGPKPSIATAVTSTRTRTRAAAVAIGSQGTTSSRRPNSAVATKTAGKLASSANGERSAVRANPGSCVSTGALALRHPLSRRPGSSCDPPAERGQSRAPNQVDRRRVDVARTSGDGRDVSFEVEFRNAHGQAAAIGSAGPYTLVVDRPADAGGQDWASTKASCCISRWAGASQTTCVVMPAPAASD